MISLFIKLDIHALESPEMLKYIAIIGDENKAVGLFARLLCYAAKHARDGKIQRLWDDLHFIMRTDREAIDALLEAGLVEQTDEGPVIANWDVFGEYFEKLERERQRYKERRLRKSAQNGADLHIEKKREEKKREEKKSLLTCASPDDDARAENDHYKPRPPFTSKKQEQLFDQFWQLYPRKKNKGQAERVWAKLRPNDELFASILAGLERAKASYDWQKEGGKYIPYPATWLNAKAWEDEYTPVEEVNRGNGTYQQSFIKPGVTKSLDEARRNRFAAIYQHYES